MTVFRGHTENAGHFLQLAIMAIGHKVMALLLLLLFEHRAERDVAHERHCERVGAVVISIPSSPRRWLVVRGRIAATSLKHRVRSASSSSFRFANHVEFGD